MIRMLDHTADVGFELEAPTLEDLFDEARQALLMTMFEEPPKRGERVVRLSAPDRKTLLVRWINELVFLVQDEGSCRPARISGSGRAKEVSPSKRVRRVSPRPRSHGWQGEIKSATFHGLEVTRGSLGWRAQMILDV